MAEKFALRLNDWVIWNFAGWNDQGWINLGVTFVVTAAGVPRPVYRLGWNGERFSECTDLVRLAGQHPDQLHVLKAFLAAELIRPLEGARNEL